VFLTITNPVTHDTGAVVERGATCTRRQYRSFLRRCLLAPNPQQQDRGAGSLWGEGEEWEEEEEEGDDDGLWIKGEGSSGLPSRPWEGLRLRVERGVR
jgi:hypothetical protein